MLRPTGAGSPSPESPRLTTWATFMHRSPAEFLGSQLEWRVLSERLVVVLVSTRNPLNIGAAARAMSNFGFAQLRVVSPYEVAWREARSAVGATALLASAEEYSSVAGAVEDCSLVIGTTAASNRELHHSLRAPQDGSRLIRNRSGRVALLFGSEKRGLSNDDFSHCHWLMRIPTREQHGSMNLGQAVAVCLYELSKSLGKTKQAKAKLATAGQLEAITGRLLQALEVSGYLQPEPGPAAEAKIRRLVRRLQVPSEDVETWLGIWRQILWKLRKEST